MATNNNGKNAYEIRLEVLQMAIGQTESAYYQEVDRIRAARPDDKGPYELPEDKRVRDALKIAKKLYAFVEGDQTESAE
jgi:hypothetical protein